MEVEFDIPGKVPWIWNPENGDRKLLPVGEFSNRISLEMGPAETKLLVFDREKEGEVLETGQAISQNPLIMEGTWNLRLDHVNGSSTERKIEDLIDFNSDENLRSFAGIIVYQKMITIEHPEDYHFIDLGKVSGVSEVIVNGESLGIKWYGRHRYPLDNSLRNGANEIRIRVTTVLGNYMKSLEENPTARRWTGGQEYHSLGMLGPVKLL